MISLLRPLSFLYAQVVAVKNSFYDKGWAFQYKAPCRVLSVGNLTMGGTGKTPLTDALVKEFLQLHQKVAVVSRSYRAQAQEPVQVEPNQEKAAQFFGDEPVQLALANPQADFYVGPKKWQTARMAVSQNNYDVIIVDDGFQHRPLMRDLDIVVLDATENLKNYELVPEGRARESWDALQRATVIAVTKCNWVTKQQLEALNKRIPGNKKTIWLNYDLKRVRDVQTGEEKPISAYRAQSAFVVSAIGRPEVFEKQISQTVNVLGRQHFRDHHPYSSEDAQNIVKQFLSSHAQYLISTEKDAVKLKSLIPPEIPFLVACLQVEERENKGELREILRQFIQ